MESLNVLYNEHFGQSRDKSSGGLLDHDLPILRKITDSRLALAPPNRPSPGTMRFGCA